MSIQLGPFQLDHPFVVAPMAGITNSPFRRLMRKMKSSLVISELVSANGMEFASQRTLDLLKYHEEERTLGLQIFGERTELLCKASKIIEELRADFVDLNLGCPVPKVVKKGAGCALTRNPKHLYQVLSAMVKSVNIPVTIKIRTGWDAHEINVHEVVRAASDAGVAWVAIHGRTRAQGYSGEANWDLIGEVKSRATIPIVGNGDIGTPEMAVKRYRDYGVDAVWIGRAALRNPFIFEQSQSLLETGSYSQPEASQFFDLLKQQKILLDETFEEKKSMLHARKFLSWYAAGYPGCHEFRKNVFQTEGKEELWEMAFRFFQEKIDSRDFTFLSQPFLMGGHG